MGNVYEFVSKDCEDSEGTFALQLFDQEKRLVATVGWYKTPEERELLRRGAIVGFNTANDGLVVREASLR